MPLIKETPNIGQHLAVLNFNYFHVWKSVHFDDVLKVISHVAEGLEQSIEHQGSLYQTGPLKTEDWDLGDEHPRRVVFHGPFNSEAWDLDELVGLYLPPLQRGALLLTLCSAMEDQFFGLCRSVAHFHPDMPAIDSRLAGQSGKLIGARGIERAIRYLEEVVHMPGLRRTTEWTRVKSIGDVRNQFAHQNGRAFARSNAGDLGPGVSSVFIGRGFIEEKLVLGSDYLSVSMETFDRFAQQVQQALAARFP
jgi:hypothetical protein